MASSDEDSVTDLSAPPPPGAGGVLKRLRALSYGSRGQFNEDDVQPANIRLENFVNTYTAKQLKQRNTTTSK